jgi:hypothetical protein
MTRQGKNVSTSTPNESSSNRIQDSITTATSQPSGDEQSQEDSFAGEAVQQIETVVESFRTGKIKKPQAIYKIGQILAAEPKGDDLLKSNSLDQYASTLDGIEALAAQANKCGSLLADPLLGKRKDGPSEGSRGHEEFDRGHTDAGPSQAIDVDNFLEGISKGNTLDAGGHIPDERSGDESESESVDDGGRRGRSNKKQRIYESQMPWFSTEQRLRKSNTNPSCNKTQNTLDVFQRDPVTVKRWIRCASSAPAGFPNSEWDALIKGESIDIDTIFSSLHHIHRIDESIGRVGTTEIQFGRPKPAAKIETSGQWTAAFNLVVKATSFLFPHRYDELRQYGDYIEELFSAKSSTIHPKLFKYDEAVRFKVGQGQNILLTDKSEFVRYYEAIVAPDGVGTDGTSGGSKTGQKKGGKPGEKPDICHRFNGANGCSATPDKCKYKHICKKCKQRGHGKVDCKIDEAV